MENMFELTTYESGIHSTSDSTRLSRSFPKGGSPSVNLQRPSDQLRTEIQEYWRDNLQTGRFPVGSEFYQTPVTSNRSNGKGSYEYDGMANLNYDREGSPPTITGSGNKNFTHPTGHTMHRSGKGPNIVPIDNFQGNVPNDHPVANQRYTSETPFDTLGKSPKQATIRNVSVKVTDQYRMGSAGLTDE